MLCVVRECVRAFEPEYVRAFEPECVRGAVFCVMVAEEVVVVVVVMLSLRMILSLQIVRISCLLKRRNGPTDGRTDLRTDLLFEFLV